MREPTDEQLKMALAKMLPEKIEVVTDEDSESHVQWIDACRPVLPTEWLHVCWLVEGGLNQVDLDDYLFWLQKICDPKACTYKSAIRASWQQRAISLANAKRVEII